MGFQAAVWSVPGSPDGHDSALRAGAKADGPEPGGQVQGGQTRSRTRRRQERGADGQRVRGASPSPHGWLLGPGATLPTAAWGAASWPLDYTAVAAPSQCGTQNVPIFPRWTSRRFRLRSSGAFFSHRSLNHHGNKYAFISLHKVCIRQTPAE